MKSESGKMNRVACALLALVLVASAALLAGCGAKTAEQASDAPVVLEDGAEVGEGSSVVNLRIVDDEGAETNVIVHTDEEFVGAALEKIGLIEGDEEDYGLYVKTVNGITVDYEKDDGAFWSFLVGDEPSMTGVDKTRVVDGGSYGFVIEKL